MSVIAKMNVLASRAFGKGQLIELSCVCEDRLMADYHPENENVVFSKASPWGEARANVDQGPCLRQHEEVYLIFQKRPGQPPLDRVALWAPVRVVSITDFGGTSKQVEICNQYRDHRHIPEPGEINAFNLRMSIDNPGAAYQFKPGESGWWLTVYQAREISMDEALALAHGAAVEPVEA